MSPPSAPIVAQFPPTPSAGVPATFAKQKSAELRRQAKAPNAPYLNFAISS